MEKEEIRQAFAEFTKDNDFVLNPDKAHVDFILEGLLKIEEDSGLKYCPCRLRTGKEEEDLLLLCPCNFKIHETWKTQGRCWCGLFIKR